MDHYCRTIRRFFPGLIPVEWTYMADRSFTLDEAQTLLPILESLLKQAINGKKLIEDVDAELQETAHRVFLKGGMMLNVVHRARRKAEREKAIRRVKDALAEIDATGVQVKDLDIGFFCFSCQLRRAGFVFFL